MSIKNDEGYYQYGHLDPEALYVSAGENVSQGQLIGQYADPTNGSSSAPHVHLELRLWSNPGTTVNPGSVSPLGDGGEVTAPFEGIDNMHKNPRQGIDYAY